MTLITRNLIAPRSLSVVLTVLCAVGAHAANRRIAPQALANVVIVTSISPTSGTTAGGTTVTLRGHNFIPGATAVTFGSIAAASVDCSSSTSCTAVAPAGTGKVDVRVSAGGDQSPDGELDDFEYVAPACNAGLRLTGSGIAAATTLDAFRFADVDGDAITDRLTAAGTSINVELGTASGSFGPMHSFTGLQSPSSIGVADLDSDGNADLLVTSTAADSVSVLLGSGAGAFGAPASYAAGSDPTRVVLADFDEDGLTDVIVANASGNATSFLRGRPSGLFQALSPIDLGSPQADAVGGDFDGDGHSDFAVALSDTNQVAVCKGLGDGTFDITTLTLAANARAVATADFDKDGILDFAVLTAADALELFHGSASGPPVRFITIALDTEVTGVAAGDVDGDADADVIVSGSNGALLINNSGYPSFNSPLTILSAPSLSRPQIIDVSGDSWLDAAFLQSSGSGALQMAFAACSAPTVTSISPTSGPGYSKVTITGTNFDPTGSLVRFGSMLVTNVTCASTTVCTAYAPSGTLGATVNVTVLNRYAESEVNPAATFTYILGPPSYLSATMSNSNRAILNFGNDPNAAFYIIERRGVSGGFAEIGTSDGPFFTDESIASNTAFVYRVRSSTNGRATVSDPSMVDFVTTFGYDAPIVAGVTKIRARNITELRSAINAAEQAFGLSTTNWTDATLSGNFIKAIHVNELRSAMNSVRAAAGMTALSFSDDPLTAGTVVKKAHVIELRVAAKGDCGVSEYLCQ